MPFFLHYKSAAAKEQPLQTAGAGRIAEAKKSASEFTAVQQSRWFNNPCSFQRVEML
jgi:hypothetical protein